MESIQQEINIHKKILMNLMNELINTDLIKEEIIINNKIKTESEFLNSLFKIKQNKINPNNTIEINPFLFKEKSTIIIPPMNLNMNVFEFNPEQINKNCVESNNNDYIELLFTSKNSRKLIVVNCNKNESIFDLIEKYRDKANDYNNNHFFWNSIILNKSLKSTINEIGLKNHDKIIVNKTCISLGALGFLRNIQNNRII